MNHSLPGIPAIYQTYLQTTEDAGSPPETGRGLAHPPPPRAEGVFYSQTIQLSEGGSEQSGQREGVKHPQSRLSMCPWHQWSQNTGLPSLGLRRVWEVSKAAHGAQFG